jgi:hypothetical protein
MSVDSVSGGRLQRDLVSALRLARTAGTQQVDAASFAAASQESGATQGAASAGGTGTASSTPALSSDLMASLLQLQSDFSQLGLQNGVAAPGSSEDAGDGSAPTAATAVDSTSGPAPVRHRHGHHARATASDGSDAASAGTTGTGGAEATATSGTASDTPASSDAGSGLESFLQQVTKAIAAYATGGPAGLAAAALTSPSKS